MRKQTVSTLSTFIALLGIFFAIYANAWFFQIACREIFVAKLHYFPQFYVYRVYYFTSTTSKYYKNTNIMSSQFKYTANKTKQAKRVINLLPLNHFHPHNRYRTDELKKKATNYRERFGHSLRSAIGCQRKSVKIQFRSNLPIDCVWMKYVSPVR